MSSDLVSHLSVIKKDRKSDRLRRKIPLLKGICQLPTALFLRSRGSLCSRNRPATSGGVAFAWGYGCVCGKRATAGLAAPRRAALPGAPLIVLMLRHGLGVGSAGSTCLGSDVILLSVFVPLRQSPRLGDTVRVAGSPLLSIATTRCQRRLHAIKGGSSAYGDFPLWVGKRQRLAVSAQTGHPPADREGQKTG